MKTLTTLDLRRKLGGILTDVSKKKEQVIISRANKPLVVIISVEEFEEKILKKNREMKLRNLSNKISAWSQKHAKALVHVDAVKAIREIRDK